MSDTHPHSPWQTPNSAHSYTEGCELDPDELQQERAGLEHCRRCGGTGHVPAGTSSSTFMGLLLIVSITAVSFGILGLGIGYYCRGLF
jgi:hypothetical protein